MTLDRREVLLAFADDEHLMGQRHTEWIGVAPFLEEDLAFSSIAQDELGHAVMLYELVGTDDGHPAGGTVDVDAFAFGRDRDDWRSCWLVEEPCTDWADALVRHWLYDAAERLRWDALATWDDAAVRAVAARAQREEEYHRRHADALLDALAGDPDADRRLAAALDRLLPLALALFDAPPFDGRVPEEWRSLVDRRFGRRDWTAIRVLGGDRRARSEHFDDVYGRMREVFEIDPTATW